MSEHNLWYMNVNRRRVINFVLAVINKDILCAIFLRQGKKEV